MPDQDKVKSLLDWLPDADIADVDSISPLGKMPSGEFYQLGNNIKAVL